MIPVSVCMNRYTYAITHPCATYTYQDDPGWSEVASAEEGGTMPGSYPDAGNPDSGPLVCAASTLPKEPSPPCRVLVQLNLERRAGFQVSLPVLESNQCQLRC